MASSGAVATFIGTTMLLAALAVAFLPLPLPSKGRMAALLFGLAVAAFTAVAPSPLAAKLAFAIVGFAGGALAWSFLLGSV